MANRQTENITNSSEMGLGLVWYSLFPKKLLTMDKTTDENDTKKANVKMINYRNYCKPSFNCPESKLSRISPSYTGSNFK